MGVDDVAQLDPEWWSPDPLWFLASCAVLLGVNLASGLIWSKMVHDLGGPKLPPGTSIRVFLLANLGRYVPGKVWQLAGLVALAARRGVPASIASTAAILGHTLSLAAATLVGGVVFASATGGLGFDGRWLTVGVALALAAFLTRRGYAAVTGLLEHLPRWEGDSSALAVSDARRWVGYLVLAWVGYGFAFALLAQSYGVEAPMALVGPAFVAAYVLGYVALFAPAGLGVREVALTGILEPFTGAGIALGLAVVSRLWITMIEVVPGAVFAGRELQLKPNRA